jgi:MoxR-like ATPase
MHAIAQQFRTLQDELNARFLEREDAIEAYLLAVLAGEHIFVLGPPGTAKSDLTDALANAFINARYFKCAMSKTRSADSVLGPLDILEFRNNGHMYRKDKGFLTQSDIVFIDEIGKMSPILGHDMLAALNEREKHEVNGGLSVHKIPLSTAFACSNEVPTDESDDAAALWDRLLFRVVVDYIKSGKNFATLLRGNLPAVTTKIDWTDVRQAIEVEVPAVTLSQDALKAILALRKALGDKNIHVSDRRWRKSVKALQAKAFLEGRTEVFEEDLSALRFTLWETIPQIEDITKLSSSASNPFVEPVLEAKKLLQEITKGMNDRSDKSLSEKSDYAKEINPKLTAVRESLDKLLTTAAGRSIPGFKDVADLHRDTLKRMFVDCFGLDEDTASSAISNKLGLGDGTKQPVSA